MKRLGLNEGETKIYKVLLERGPLSASTLARATGLKPGDCYNKAYALVERGLVEEYEVKNPSTPLRRGYEGQARSGKKHFRLSDPRKLDELSSSQYQVAGQTKREIEGLLPELLSAYTLSHHRPGVVFFEGDEALRRVPEDSLSARGDILQYIDSETVEQYLAKDSAAHARTRKRLGKRKRIIIPDSPANRKHAKASSSALTEYRVMPKRLPRFSTSMLIYNDKIAYMTLQPGERLGVILEDRWISAMHRGLFEFLWEQSLTTDQL